jgi:uncharacterized protein YxeA
MKKLLIALMAVLFLGSTTGLVYAQATTGDQPVKITKTTKGHKGGKKGHKGGKKGSKQETKAAPAAATTPTSK